MIMALLAAIAATALWGFTFIGPKAVDPVNVWYLVIGRYAVFAILSASVLWRGRQTLSAMRRTDILFALHLGMVGYIGFYLFLSLSIVTSGGVLASLITGIMPAAVATVWNARTRETPWRRVALPLVLTTLGLAVLNVQHSIAGLPQKTDRLILGSLLALIACAAWVYFVVSNARWLQKTGAPPRNDLWAALIGLGAGVGSLCVVPFVFFTSGASPFASLATFLHFAAWCVLLALLGSWCATWFWTWSARKLPTALAAQIIAAETIFGAAFNLAWECRLPTPVELVGGALVLGGVAICVALYENDKRSKAVLASNKAALVYDVD